MVIFSIIKVFVKGANSFANTRIMEEEKELKVLYFLPVRAKKSSYQNA